MKYKYYLRDTKSPRKLEKNRNSFQFEISKQCRPFILFMPLHSICLRFECLGIAESMHGFSFQQYIAFNQCPLRMPLNCRVLEFLVLPDGFSWFPTSAIFSIHKQVFFWYALYLTPLHLPPLWFRCVRECWDRSSNPGLLLLWHWQSEALTTRLDLVHDSTRYHLIYLYCKHASSFCSREILLLLFLVSFKTERDTSLWQNFDRSDNFKYNLYLFDTVSCCPGSWILFFFFL